MRTAAEQREDMLAVAAALGMPKNISQEEAVARLQLLQRLSGNRAISWKRIARLRQEHDLEARLALSNLEDMIDCLRHQLQCSLGTSPSDTALWQALASKGIEQPVVQASPLPPKTFQRYIVEWLTGRENNCLVVLPTGYGKTLCFALAIERDVCTMHQGGVVLLTAPTHEIVEQHVQSFASGKYGQCVQSLIDRGKMHIGTPKSMATFVDDLSHNDTPVLLLLDEGDIGIKAETGKYETFRIVERLSLRDHPLHRRLIAMTATGYEHQHNAYAHMLGIDPATNILDLRDTAFAEMLLRHERKKLKRVVHVSPTDNHTYVIGLLQQKLHEVILPLRTAFVHHRTGRQGFPRFPVPKEGKEDVIPCVTHAMILELKQRLAMILDDTFHELPGRQQTSLRGLCERFQRDPKRTQEEIELYRRQLSIYASLIDLFHTVECGSYAPLIEKMRDIAERTLTTQARLMIEGKKSITHENIQKLIRRFNRLPTKFQGNVRTLHQLFTRLRLAEDIDDEPTATKSMDDITHLLEELAREAPAEPPAVWEYTVLYDPLLRKAVESIPTLHPKEVVLLKLLERQSRKTDTRILVKVQHRSTLLRLTALVREHGYRADFLVGGTDRQTKLHNALARERFETGSINMLFGTSVMSRGIDLKGANTLIMYDLSFGDPELTQILGRVGRTDEMFARVYALAYNGGGSRDQILIAKFDENYRQMLLELGAAALQLEDSA